MIKRGSTRLVFIIGWLAFKMPNPYSWRTFLQGLLANMQERKFSKVRVMQDKLCPVRFSLPLGFLIVMPRVRVLKKDELTLKELEIFCTCNGNFVIPSELKYNSFGYLNDKLVAIDYGS